MQFIVNSDAFGVLFYKIQYDVHVERLYIQVELSLIHTFKFHNLVVIYKFDILFCKHIILIGAFKALVLEDAWVEGSNIVSTGFMLMCKRHLFFLSPIFKYLFSKCLMHITLEFEGHQSFLFTNLTHIFFRSSLRGNEKTTVWFSPA